MSTPTRHRPHGSPHSTSIPPSLSFILQKFGIFEFSHPFEVQSWLSKFDWFFFFWNYWNGIFRINILRILGILLDEVTMVREDVISFEVIDAFFEWIYFIFFYYMKFLSCLLYILYSTLFLFNLYLFLFFLCLSESSNFNKSRI